jgi:hypothetical protein
MSGIRWAGMLEDNPLTVMDRIKGTGGAAITQATINTITYRVFQYDNYNDLLLDQNGSEVGVQASITKADAVFDTLQTDDYWTEVEGGPPDDEGYNFRFTVPPARFPSASKFYRVEITFTPTTGDAFKIVWAVSTTAVASS